ncbi:protein of unknown function [Cyanobium sp. NIES-981]|nr:protein of unknown function [Cyanobium sp. NIES-981]
MRESLEVTSQGWGCGLTLLHANIVLGPI